MTKTLQCALHVALFIQTQVDFELVVMCAMNGMILNVLMLMKIVFLMCIIT